VFKDIDLLPVQVRRKAYEALKDAIIQGRLRPGERLIEIQLAEMLSISRTPLREAILRLESEGFVQRLSSGGARVTPLSAQDVRDLYAIRAVLEGLAGREAAERITEAQLDRLFTLTRELQAIEEDADLERVAQLGEQFHLGILEASGNRKLGEHLRLLRDQIQRYRYLTIQLVGRGRAAAGEHAQLLEVLLRRDPAQAEQAMRQHIDQAWHSMMIRLREVDLGADGVDQ
jgi:DNA-binding GntR family transcriptional regulator